MKLEPYILNIEFMITGVVSMVSLLRYAWSLFP